MLFITHDLGVVAQLCDRILVMYAGRIVEDAPVAEFFSKPCHPYSRGLLASLPSLAAEQGGLISIPGSPPQPGEFPAGCRFAPRCAYARDRCLTEDPPLVTADSSADHVYACWYPVGSPEFQARDEQIMNGLHTASGQLEDRS